MKSGGVNHCPISAKCPRSSPVSWLLAHLFISRPPELRPRLLATIGKTDYFGDNAYRPSVMAHHAWVRTFPGLPMNRHGTYSWNVPHLYLFCLWVIYGFLAKTPTISPESISLKNNRIPVPLLPPYPLDGWNISVVLPIRGLRPPGVHHRNEILYKLPSSGRCGISARPN